MWITVEQLKEVYKYEISHGNFKNYTFEQYAVEVQKKHNLKIVK